MKYLLELISLFNGLKKGIQKYSVLWKDQPFTAESVQADIDAVQAMDDSIAVLETEISKKKKEARILENEKQAIADKIAKIANGFHADKQEQLLDYGLKLRKVSEAKQRPTKQLIASVEDDSDGQGFVVYSKVDADANNYEWEKGQSVNAADVNTIPEMKFFKYLSKTSFIDDDVAKGVRYFYRVRAVNTAGEGPWSEVVSRVQ